MWTMLALAIPAVIWLSVSVFIHAFGEYFSKLWANDPGFTYALLATLAYALSGLFWFPILLHKNHISTMGTLWLLMATAATIIIGVFVFQEQLTFWDSVGIGLAILALVVLSF